MSKEPGPREKALREMREANYERNKPTRKELKARVAEAAKKTGKSRKVKK
jgi:hypothetical protein